MASQPQFDDEPFIVESKFAAAFAAAKIKYPYISEDLARQATFMMCQRIFANYKKPQFEREDFHTMKSGTISTLGIFDENRSGYHSLIIRYAKDHGFGRSRQPRPRQVPLKPVLSIFWSEVFRLCELEQPLLRIERGEDRLDPNWEPEYHGPSW